MLRIAVCMSQVAGVRPDEAQSQFFESVYNFLVHGSSRWYNPRRSLRLSLFAHREDACEVLPHRP